MEQVPKRPLEVFRHRPFLIFWVGACISNTGNWTENAAQSWAVTTQTVGNPHQGLLVEVLQFADFCPVLLLALFAGVISDRVNLIPLAMCGFAVVGLLFSLSTTPVLSLIILVASGACWLLSLNLPSAECGMRSAELGAVVLASRPRPRPSSSPVHGR